MKRRTFLKGLGLTASLPWLRGVAKATEAESSPNPRNSLKILTCNIRVDVPDDAKTGNSWADRRALCAEVIQAQQADVICFQEMQNAHYTFLKSKLPSFGSYGLSNPGPAFDPFNAIFFSRGRFEMVSAGGFWLCETSHIAGSKSWDSARSRFANWVDLKERSSGAGLRVWNTHLDHLGQLAREQGARMLVQACLALPHDFPQLLTADLNAGETNPAVKNLKTGGWRDTYAAVNGSEDPGFTFHGFKGNKSGGKTADGKTRAKIDWIFSRGSIKPVAAAIIRDSRNGRCPSDHYFVSAELAHEASPHPL